MSVGIYGIFDSRDGTCLYVGQSATIEFRCRKHLSNLKRKHPNALEEFIDWFHENGANEDILKFETLENCVDEDKVKNAVEQKWFRNLSPKFRGKIPSENEKWKHSKETREKLSSIFTERSNTDYLLKIEEILELSSNPAISISKMAETLGFSRQCLTKFLNRQGIINIYTPGKLDIVSHQMGLTSNDFNLLLKSKRDSGSSYEEIAQEFNVTPKAIVYRINLLNV